MPPRRNLTHSETVRRALQGFGPMQQKKLRQKHLQAQQEAREQEERTRKTKVQMNTSEQFEEQRRQAAMERALVSPSSLVLAETMQTHALQSAEHAV